MHTLTVPDLFYNGQNLSQTLHVWHITYIGVVEKGSMYVNMPYIVCLGLKTDFPSHDVLYSV